MQFGVRFKLSVMMFLQYAIWGAWAVSLGGYMGNTLSFTGLEIGAIFSTTAIAAMISPLLMGFLADRLFATEKLIGVLHLAGAVMLLCAAFTEEFQTLYVMILIYAMLYMPTLALTNSLAFANIGDPEKDFPKIRVWGTWGWIVVGWLVGFVLDVPPGTKNTPVLLAALSSAALGILSFTYLPHTPPKGKVAASKKTGAGVRELLTDPSFLIFVVCSFLVCIPLSFYYAQANVFLTEIDAPMPTALQTVGQLSEVGFMLAMPFFIVKLGVKRMLMCGMLAWSLRYLAFGSSWMPLIVFGLFLHGICYDFFFVASQIYVDSRADVSQRASAQSFIAFVTLGLGMLVGSIVSGFTVDMYPPRQKIEVTLTSGEDGKTKTEEARLPNWSLDDPNTEDDERTGLALKLNLNADSKLTADRITEPLDVKDEATGDVTTFSAAALQKAVETAGDKGGGTTREDWRIAQRNDWLYIWLWPAIGALLTCALFQVGFTDWKRETTDSDQEADTEPAADEPGADAPGADEV